ncbi:MAG: phosphoribosylanthranilate isomerase [Thermomicrobiales bacterium]
MTTADNVRLAPGSVKICGLRTPKHAGAAALAGADLIGFVFADDRRRVTPDEAAASIKAARMAAGCRRLIAVGVFVNESAETINAVVETAGLDLVQLQGDEDPGMIGELSRPVVKALRLPPGGTVRDAEETIARYQDTRNSPVAYLIDGYDPSHYGGQGVRADWDLAKELAHGHPVMLAGGLDGVNVGQAIRHVQPHGVDVSSGVEIDGVKDIAKITAFVDAAKSEFKRSVTWGIQ